MLTGGDFDEEGIVGKVYFLPHVLARASGVSPDDLFINCVNRISPDLASQFQIVQSFMQSLPPSSRPPTEMVAVDCVSPRRNRLKIYYRTPPEYSSFDDIIYLTTLGGALTDPSMSLLESTLWKLWSLLFPGVSREQKLIMKRPEHYPSGFLIYYEMALGRKEPIPKVYIPVRHFCENDRQIGNALAQYYRDVKMGRLGENYAGYLGSLL
jgi:tryptophan 7-dimethylallyltransferase